MDELYNNSNSEINLSNYYLSDDLNNLEKWQLPEIILEPNDFKTFYCSGKNNIDSLIVDLIITIILILKFLLMKQ